MKNITFILLAFFLTSTIFGQEISGDWTGILKIPSGKEIRIVFHVTKSETGYRSTMDSPDQKAFEIPVVTTTFENSILKCAIPNAQIEYEGTLKENRIIGFFKQGGQSVPMDLYRNKTAKLEPNLKLNRPQEPIKPYAYYSEDVLFPNKNENINLAGTLTLPKKEGPFPVVILITGSGPQNRDEELLGHKPFLVLSDYLTKNGIAVLRYDDRGIGLSKGDFKTATTQDFSTDVLAAIAYLKTRKEINKNKIGLIGHSEGGVIAPMVASKSKDIAFIVLMAGPGLEGKKLILLQKELIERQMGIPETDIAKGQEIIGGAYDIVMNSNNNETLVPKVQSYFKEKFNNQLTDNLINPLTNQITSPWWKYFLKYNPAMALENVICPVLAINGEKDLQVPAKPNIEAISKSLAKGGNKKVTAKILPNLNHLFQECTTGSVDEYSKIEQTISPIALNEILTWIKTQTK